MLLEAPKTVDEYLQDLMVELSQYEVSSPERQKIINRLLRTIQRLPGILKSSHPDYPEALNRTWIWVNRTIHRIDIYAPCLADRLVNWINSYLRWRIRDLYAPDEYYLLSLDRPLNNSEGERTTMLDLLPDPKFPLCLSLLDIHILKLQEDERDRIGLKMRTYIEQDPDGKLQNCYPRRYPTCHCQLLARRFLLQEPPDRLARVAEDFNINYQTLNSHWKQKCLPLLQDICRYLGYQS